MVAFHKRILLFFIAATLPLPSMAQWACQDVFEPQSVYFSEVVNEAFLKKVIQKNKKLSPNDLTRMVNNLFEKYEGEEYDVAHYFQMTPAERTRAVLFREMRETVTHRGLEELLKQHNLTKDSSSLLTKLWVINRSKSFNIISTVWDSVSLMKGNPPIFLAEVFFEMKPQDMDTLLLKGLNSKEGLEIANRYGFKQEVVRGYSLVSRYYARLAITVAFFILFDEVDDFLERDHDSIVSDVWTLFLSELQKYEEALP